MVLTRVIKNLNFVTLISVILLVFNFNKALGDAGKKKNTEYRKVYKQKKIKNIKNQKLKSAYQANTIVAKVYLNYSAGNYNNVFFATNNFLQYSLRNEKLAYIYYINAMSNYNYKINKNQDRKFINNAHYNFSLLTLLFFKTEYAHDAKWKIEYIRNIFLLKEMNIARFYLSTYNARNIKSFINRFSNVINKYQENVFFPEALYKLAEIYYILGVKNQIYKHVSLLNYYYPYSIWCFKSRILFKKYPHNLSWARLQYFYQYKKNYHVRYTRESKRKTYLKKIILKKKRLLPRDYLKHF